MLKREIQLSPDVREKPHAPSGIDYRSQKPADLRSTLIVDR